MPDRGALQAVCGLLMLGVGLWLMSPGWALVVIGGIVALDAVLSRAKGKTE